MNKEYALDILEMVERGTCESNCSLAIEAYEYLYRLKSTNQELLDRIYDVKFKSQW